MLFQPTGRYQVQKAIKIGRLPTNDVVVDDLGVSRVHAELRRGDGDGSYEIVDLGSHNGTYVNGQRISTMAVTGADLVGIGHSTFRLVDGQLREFIDAGRRLPAAQDLTVRRPTAELQLPSTM